MQIWVGKERKENLLKLKRALEKVSGKSLSYGDAIDFLLDFFLSFECEDSFEKKIKKKIKTLSSFYPYLFSEKEWNWEDLVEVVPPYLKKKLREVARSKKLPEFVVFQESLDVGLSVQETFPLFLPEGTTQRLLKSFTALEKVEGKEKADKFLREIAIKVNNAVLREVEKVEKRLKKKEKKGK